MYLSENIAIASATAAYAPIPPQGMTPAADVLSGTTAGDWADMENYRYGRVVCIGGSIDAGGLVTFTLMAATTNAGASSSLSAKTATLGATSDDLVTTIDFDAGDLATGYQFVGVKVSVSNADTTSSAFVAAVIERAGTRYARGTLLA